MSIESEQPQIYTSVKYGVVPIIRVGSYWVPVDQPDLIAKMRKVSSPETSSKSGSESGSERIVPYKPTSHSLVDRIHGVGTFLNDARKYLFANPLNHNS